MTDKTLEERVEDLEKHKVGYIVFMSSLLVIWLVLTLIFVRESAFNSRFDERWEEKEGRLYERIDECRWDAYSYYNTKRFDFCREVCRDNDTNAVRGDCFGMCISDDGWRLICECVENKTAEVNYTTIGCKREECTPRKVIEK